MRAHFGVIVRRLRLRKAWYVSELARAAGVDASDLSRYENDKMDPSLANAVKIADALGVSLDVLLGREPMPRADERYGRLRGESRRAG